MPLSPEALGPLAVKTPPTKSGGGGGDCAEYIRIVSLPQHTSPQRGFALVVVRVVVVVVGGA